MRPFSDFGAVLLAAGFSRRMGGENKLLKPLKRRPLIAHTLAGLAGLELAQLIVVVGEAEPAIAPLLPRSAVAVRNLRAEQGMGASLAAGAARLDRALAGAFVVLGDMPLVERADYERLAAAFKAAGRSDAICVPLHDGQRGHPVLFGAQHFPALAALEGDRGARHLLNAAGARLIEVDGCSAGVLADFDTPASFAAYENGQQSR